MDLFNEDIIELWASLYRNDVSYIMVGGFAANLNGYNRFTGDIDLWLQDSIENRKKLVQSLVDIGLPEYKELLTTQLIPGWTSINLPSGFELDLMTYIYGFEQGDFKECEMVASEFELNDFKVKFLHINDLIKTKEASNRPKDQLDALELKKIRNSQ